MLQRGWNISLPFEQSIDQVLLAGKWKSQIFRYEFNEFIPVERGIYFLTLQGKTEKLGSILSTLITPIYVGMSESSIRQRFKIHVSGNRPDQLWRKLTPFPNQVKFYYLILPGMNKDKICELEQNLIDVYGPTLNQINSISKGSTLTGRILKEETYV